MLHIGIATAFGAVQHTDTTEDYDVRQGQEERYAKQTVNDRALRGIRA